LLVALLQRARGVAQRFLGGFKVTLFQCGGRFGQRRRDFGVCARQSLGRLLQRLGQRRLLGRAKLGQRVCQVVGRGRRLGQIAALQGAAQRLRGGVVGQRRAGRLQLALQRLVAVRSLQ